MIFPVVRGNVPLFCATERRMSRHAGFFCWADRAQGVLKQFFSEKDPSKPEAQAKVVESQVFPSLALRASIAVDFSQQAQLQKLRRAPERRL
jgi:hypothetical protein